MDRTAVNLQALLKRVQKVQPAVVQKRVRAQKVLQAAAQTILQVRNQKLLQMTRLAVLQVQGLHQEQHQKVKWIKDDRKSVCFNRRTLLIFFFLQEIFSGEELDMKKEQVLLIEDDADIREGVRILLESENYCVEEAENGKSGLELLSDETDLVILDIMMPGMSGLRTCEEIRKVSNVPVLFLTAKAQESDKLIGLMAGGDDYLAKPFSYAELLGRVKALLRRYNIYRGRNNEVREEAEPYLRR